MRKILAGVRNRCPVDSVTERALYHRVQRRLSHDGERLKTCSYSSRWFSDLGRYYAVDCNNNICHTHIDLESFGRELGVLAKFESLAQAA
jgi:hypothetical protein